MSYCPECGSESKMLCSNCKNDTYNIIADENGVRIECTRCEWSIKIEEFLEKMSKKGNPAEQKLDRVFFNY